VTGSSGLIGSVLVDTLTRHGHRVTRYNRAQPQLLDGFDAVVHLAGESIMGRWTKRKKQRIRQSRIELTRQLSECIARTAQRPRVLLCASAIGFYGDRGTEPLNEDSTRGAGFLADVVSEWEHATEPAAQAGIRVVNLRFGVVLAARGGALKQMLLPFKLGMGGIIGSGRQFWSWIAVDDVVGAITHLLGTDDARGPINIVSPQQVTNREFTKTLGRVLRRPTILPLPGFVARIVLGEMAEDLLLSSSRIFPIRLEATGYKFQYPLLEEALHHILGR